MQQGELQALVSACPALTDLRICHALEEDNPSVAQPLLQLPGSLTSLSVGGPALDDAAAAVIKELTQLQRLNWLVSPELTDAGVVQLTALQQLEHLQLFRVEGVSQVLMDDPEPLHEGGSGAMFLTAGPKVRWTVGFAVTVACCRLNKACSEAVCILARQFLGRPT